MKHAQHSKSQRFALLLAGLAPLALAPAASAIDLSGNLSDSTTGPIPAGVHRVVGTITVPAGQTLTVQPGAILKFAGAFPLNVHGTLSSSGTVGSPIVYTAIADDVGGDTNGDGGATSPAKGSWHGIVVSSTGIVTLDHADLRYYGWGGYSGLYVSGDGAQITATNTTIRDGSQNAIDAGGFAATYSVSNCAFIGNTSYAVYALRLDHVPGFVDNTASGNGGDHLRVTQPDPSTSLTIEEKNCAGGALVFTTTCDVPVGVTLTLKEGVVVKGTLGVAIQTNGTLVTTGTALKPVVLTALTDDDHGGDSNSDGPSNGAPGAIRGLIFAANSTGNSIAHTIVRYSGWGGYSSVYLAGSGVQASFANSTFRDGSTHGIDANQFAATLSVTDCAIIGNAQYAGYSLLLDHVPGFVDNVASGNGENYLYVTQPDPTGNVTVEEKNCLGGALVFSTTCDVPNGVTLTLKEGVVVKGAAGVAIDVVGTLVTTGTDAKPVVLTAFADDDHGGDTNNDGPSNGVPGQIRGVIFSAGSTGNTLDHTIVRYGGWGGYSNAYVQGAGAQASLVDSRFSDGSQSGLDANGFPADLTVTRCTFADNSQYAAQQLRIEHVPGFLDNEASGNGANYMRVTEPDPTGNVTVVRENCIGDVLVFTTSSDVNLGHSLTLEKGVIVKFTVGGSLVSNGGSIHLKGDAETPVVLTSIEDDAFGGDTNEDGSTTVPAKGEWQGVRFTTNAGASTLRHVLIRYPGWGGWYGLRSQSSTLDARFVRVEHAADYGFYISGLSYGSDWVAWNGNNDGIRIDGGSFVLERCTSAKNTGAGIWDAGFGGLLNSSVAFGNGGGEISGFSAGEVKYSNGASNLAGMDGNIIGDPLFVDMQNGDLTLAAGSPCIEVGDPLDFLPNGDLDLSGVPRILDGDFDKVPRVDMGAYEFDHVRLSVTGTFQPLGNVTFTSTGTPGLVSFMFIGVDRGKLLFYPYGTLLIDPLSTYILVGWPGPPTAPSFVVPVNVPTPQPITCQQVVFQGSTAGGGNLSNAESFVIDAP